MNDELNAKIKKISDILGKENIPDNLISLFKMMSNNKTENEMLNDEEPINREDNKTNKNYYQQRISLLKAVSPFLNEERQEKISQCIKILNVASIAKLIDEA